jgi:hypothetical protein
MLCSCSRCYAQVAHKIQFPDRVVEVCDDHYEETRQQARIEWAASADECSEPEYLGPDDSFL